MALVDEDGSISGPSMDSRAMPKSSWVLCRRQRAESFGLPCMGHEPWSAPCAHVQTISEAELPAASTTIVVPVTINTWRNSQAAVTGTS
jgi:hypothetical protein